MTHLLLGFLIAVSVGLTGIGGGSFTVPALLLIAGLPPAEAVGTTFVFAGILKLIAAPFYMASRQVHSRYFRLLLLGTAVPGLVIGMLALERLAKANGSGLIVLVVGILLTISSTVSFVPRAQFPGSCAPKFALAAMARVSDWCRVRILFCRCGRLRDSAPAELIPKCRRHRWLVPIFCLGSSWLRLEPPFIGALVRSTRRS